MNHAEYFNKWASVFSLIIPPPPFVIINMIHCLMVWVSG